ncbi:uncharacterized protein LOC103714053 [Phoenix dactylifera]|uniref:Uncharacterized protein LOC103714053 n=1 Tax=Phoenix dactylifera TaxID=42345 RepID=A0A8B7CI29_PHODC|nr:uncharacterized protein LOC103714053 [Phoenix dactylifera]
MDANLVAPSSSLCPKSSFHLKKPSFKTQPFLFTGPVRLRPRPVRATGPSTSTDNGEANTNDGREKAEATAALPRSRPTTLNIKYRRRSRNQARQEQQQSMKKPPPPPPKDWDSMTLGEKALELYAGEKGLLFWLNKFAYASIFIIIGGWILFRFVGPSLGLYQLDSPPISPSTMFKSSS